jgi:hypothetical protein
MRKPNRTHGVRELPRGLEAFVVDAREIRTDGRILRHVAIEIAGDFNLEMLGCQAVEQLLNLWIITVHDGDDFEELVERDRDRRRFNGKLDHGSAKCTAPAMRAVRKTIATARVPDACRQPLTASGD